MYRDANERDFARALRNLPTSTEKRLWHFLRAQKLRGRKFRRQAAISAYIVDFVCFSDKLIIELDGPQHLDREAIQHDKRRTNWLISRGFHVIRFRNQELDENIHLIVDTIGRAIDELEARAQNPPFPFAPRVTTATRLCSSPRLGGGPCSVPRRGEGAEPGY